MLEFYHFYQIGAKLDSHTCMYMYVHMYAVQMMLGASTLAVAVTWVPAWWFF